MLDIIFVLAFACVVMLCLMLRRVFALLLLGRNSNLSLFSLMMMDNISLVWTHSFKYLGKQFQAKGIIQVDCLAIKRKFYSLYYSRPTFQRSASAAEPVPLQLVIRLECIRGESWIYSAGQKNGLHAFGYSSAESEPIWMKFATL